MNVSPLFKRVSEFARRSVRIASGRKFRGFTLVELIVVIAILAILSTIGFLALSGYSQDAKDATFATNVRSVSMAIASESALSGNSPRYYVIHNSWASLSGAFVYVDGIQTPLAGGDWNVQWTNYSAGNPDYSKLKLNAEKFKISAFGLPFYVGLRLPTALASYGPGSYDRSYLSVGAMEASQDLASGRKRVSTFFQVAGISPVSGKVSLAGNFPGTLSVSGSSPGLIAADPAKSSTGALVDGSTSAVPTSVPAILATGGDVVGEYYSGSVHYKFHKFTTVGASSFQIVSAPSGATFDVLVVWGGGGWAGGGGGGGWAGWYRYFASQAFAVGSRSVAVGAGGAAASNGSDSSFDSIVAHGWGRGGDSTIAGQPGGSGGGWYGAKRTDGLTWGPTAGGAGNSWAFAPAEGFSGGNGVIPPTPPSSSYATGGGGGWAGGAGSPNSVSNYNGGAWGPGVDSAITGVSVGYAGGGGGNGSTFGVNGAATHGGWSGGPGTPNTGWGGGAASVGYAWGSGIVVVRYQIP